MHKKGITLIAVILLMTLLAITTFALIAFVVERLRLTAIRRNEINAYYMAQAGIHYGIYQYKENDFVGTRTYNDDDREFTWTNIVDGNNLTITSTGHSPKTGSGRMEKKLEATYDTASERLTGLEYDSEK